MEHFLIIDKFKNTLSIPLDLFDAEKWSAYIIEGKFNIRRHKTLKELDKEIRIYLHKEGDKNDDQI